jgi:lipid-A-disaccharide synthase-like uncharacterized protein
MDSLPFLTVTQADKSVYPNLFWFNDIYKLLG